MGPRRPRRRYDRNVELVLGILVIAGFVALLVWLIDGSAEHLSNSVASSVSFYA